MIRFVLSGTSAIIQVDFRAFSNYCQSEIVEQSIQGKNASKTGFRRIHGVPGRVDGRDMIVTQEDQAYNKIKIAISKGYIKKGSKLKEIPLSKSLDMSRATVKGAIKRLVFEGLAEHVPNKGVSVVSPTLEEIHQTFQVRARLEQMAVTLALPNMKPVDYRQLRDLVQKEEELFKARELDGYYEINDAFHLKIVENSGNRVLVHYVRDLLQKTTIYLVLFDPFYQLLDMNNGSPVEHRKILTFMEDKDAAASGEAMKQHLANTVSGIDMARLYPSDYLSV